jgi:hypothetical protein
LGYSLRCGDAFHFGIVRDQIQMRCIFWLTGSPLSFMLLSGMNPKIHIRGEFTRKALWTAFILLIGFSFSTGGVLASSCQGGADCLICAAAVHPHLPGMDVEMVNRGCASAAEQNSSCGFETGHSADELNSIAAVAESITHPYSGIFSAASDDFDQAHLHKRFITQFRYPARGELTPIYLLNQSLLC